MQNHEAEGALGGVGFSLVDIGGLEHRDTPKAKRAALPLVAPTDCYCLLEYTAHGWAFIYGKPLAGSRIEALYCDLCG